MYCFRRSGYFRQPSDPTQHSCFKCYTIFPADIGACPLCFKRGNCPCGNMNFYDQTYGAFSFCSPSCRDTFLLPSYNKQLEEDLKKAPQHNDSGNTAGGDFSSTMQYPQPSTSTGVAGTRTANHAEAIKQFTYGVRLPASDSCIHFYKNVWSESNKYGVSLNQSVLVATIIVFSCT